jgi:copper chaperone NosL
MRIAAAILILVWTGACAARASGPPRIDVDRSACSQCGMLISEPAYAAAIRTPDGHEHLFDEIGCLVTAVRSLPADEARLAQYWFHDAADAGWITNGSPVFVKSPDLRTPMGGGIVAYRDRASADRAAQRQTGRILSDLAELMAPERNAR